MQSNASYKKVLKYFGGTNSRRAAGHAGAPEIFTLRKFNTEPCTPRSARFPRTERMELNAGLKMFVRAHLRLSMNQRSRGFFDRPKSACSRFEGTPNSGVSVRPPSGLVLVVPGALASSRFRASRSTAPISNLGLV